MGVVSWIKDYRAFQSDPLRFLEERVASSREAVVETQFGPAWLGGSFVVANSPALAVQVLRAPLGRDFRKSIGYRRMQELLGNGLLTGFGDKWREARRAAQPTFDRRVLEGAFLPIIQRNTDLLLQELRSDHAREDVTRSIFKLTLRIASESFLGSEIGEIADQMIDDVREAQTTILHRAYSIVDIHRLLPWYRWTAHKRRIQRIRSNIAALVERRAPTNGVTAALHERIDRTQDRMSAYITLLLAGFETTANALTWTIFEVSKRPEVQQAIRTQGPGYARKVMLESLRLYPPAWIIDRETLREVQLGDHTVRKGSIVAVCPYLTHRDPAVWPNPLEFDPDRFEVSSPLRDEERGFLPFGHGPGWCLGAEFAMLEAVHVLTRVCELGPFRCESTLKPDPGITLRPNGRLGFRFSGSRSGAAVRACC